MGGVFEKFPRLHIVAAECEVAWLPHWMQRMDHAHEKFGAMMDVPLSMPPSEYVRRQIRATPYPTEDVGWIVEQAGPEVCLFSSDYPHVEGGRRPIERFERSLDGASDATRQAFYHDNFVDLMGAGLPATVAA